MTNIEVAREKIERALDQNGQYTHNIIGIVLRMLTIKDANKLIDEMCLGDFGFEKVPE
jgi:hypothetical protein